MKTIELDPKIVHCSELNTRQPTAKDVAGLVKSIGSSTGQTSSGLVRPHPSIKGHYELAAGSRRRLACEILGITFRTEIRSIPNEEFEDIILTDNLQREDPDPIAEATLIARRLAAGVEPREIAARYGKTPTWVRRRSKLIGLSKSSISAWRSGPICHFSVEMAELLGEQTHASQQSLVSSAGRCASLNDLTALIRGMARDISKATWLDDPDTFVPGCGPGCASTAQDSLFNIGAKNCCSECTNPDCFTRRQILFHIKTLRAILDKHPAAVWTAVPWGWGKRERKFPADCPQPKSTVNSHDCGRYDGCKFNPANKSDEGAFPVIDIHDGRKPPTLHFWKPSPAAKKGKGGSSSAGTTSLTRESRIHGKRYMALRDELEAAVMAAPRPAKIEILRLAASFGTDGNRSHRWKSDRAGWPTLYDGAIPGLAGTGKSPEDTLWYSIREVLRQRLDFSGRLSDATSEDLLTEMRNLAALIDFDFDAAYHRIAREQFPPPKSWAKEVDPITLQPLIAAKPAKMTTKPAKKTVKLAKKTTL